MIHALALCWVARISATDVDHMSKVLVVTPAYCTEDNRRLPLLLQTIYWVRQQTHTDYLHVVVDDGSTDSTPSVLERLSESGPKLQVFRKRNGGSSAAINYGVERALAHGTPDYITICHSDDVLLPDSLEVRVRLATQTGADFVYTDEVAIRDPSLPMWQRRALEHPTSDELFRALLDRRSIPYVTMLWGAEFFLYTLQGYDDRLTSAEDWDIALRSAKALGSIRATHATSHRVTVARRVHEDNLRIQNIRDGTKERCYEKILQKHLEGHEYRAAMAIQKKRLAKLRRPRLRLSPAVRKLVHRVLPSHVLKPRRRSPSTPVAIDPRAAAFLKEIDDVDYELISAAL